MLWKTACERPSDDRAPVRGRSRCLSTLKQVCSLASKRIVLKDFDTRLQRRHACRQTRRAGYNHRVTDKQPTHRLLAQGTPSQSRAPGARTAEPQESACIPMHKSLVGARDSHRKAESDFSPADALRDAEECGRWLHFVQPGKPEVNLVETSVRQPHHFAARGKSEHLERTHHVSVLLVPFA
jgi:hypothetical protein